MRELTDAELDIVSGGNTWTVIEATRRQPTASRENLVKEVIADILRILEPKQPAALKDNKR
jgi:hypothetical protein